MQKRVVVMVILGIILSACSKQEPVLRHADWAGTWRGPEGTFLEVKPAAPAGYHVAIRDLDALTSYKGTDTENGIAFTRNGKTETLHAGTGDDTGMKWLMDKKDCLVVTYGEGYCR